VTTGISINKVHFPVTALGHGRRIGIWTQGCSIQCAGCISRDTWDFRNDSSIPVDQLLASLDPWLAQADGVTLSGGEPFDQPQALAELVQKLRGRQSGDILIYSGYSQETLFQSHSQILKWIDVLISEPYRPESGSALALRGSDNQRITLLTDLARTRYPLDLDDRPWNGPRPLDVMIDGDTVWLAGIPRVGQMAELKRKLASFGLACGSSDESRILVRA
jgi:anaerobic ribonucleoside-triphosphate reductase activating protein